MNRPPPISFGDLPAQWIADRREIVQREGNAVRGNPETLGIEVKSLTSNEWCVLVLGATGAVEFTTAAERDEVVRRMVG